MMGNEFADGILLAVSILLAFGFTLQVIISLFKVGYDNSDDYENGKRSGVKVVVDHLTGVNYLMNPKGGITPRITDRGGVVVTQKGAE
jgi:hypothetical protein